MCNIFIPWWHIPFYSLICFVNIYTNSIHIMWNYIGQTYFICLSIHNLVILLPYENDGYLIKSLRLFVKKWKYLQIYAVVCYCFCQWCNTVWMKWKTLMYKSIYKFNMAKFIFFMKNGPNRPKTQISWLCLEMRYFIIQWWHVLFFN